MTYIVFKYQAGQKFYLSTTGKWIKSASGAVALSKDAAQARALELGACIRVYSFRN